MISYYAKAIIGAIVSGLAYLLTVIAPASHIQDITLVQWIGFAVAILGTFGGVASVTNGDKPAAQEKPSASDAPPNVSAPAAPPVSFAATQARIDAAPEVSAPEVTAPEVTAPAATPAQ